VGLSVSVQELGLSVHVDRDCVGLGDLHDVLKVLGHVLDDINVLDDLLGDVHMLDDFDLNGGINMLDDIDVLVDDLGLVHVVGALDVHNLDLRNMAHLLHGHELGHMLDHLDGGVNILGHRDVADNFLSLGDEFGDVLDDLHITVLLHDLGHVADDLLDLLDLNVLDGYGDVHGHGGLYVLDGGYSDGHLTDLGDSLDDWDLDLLLNILGDMDLALNHHLARDVADLGHLNLDGLGDLAVLDDLNGHILVHDLVLRYLDDLLDVNRASDLLRHMDVLDHSLDLHLGHLHDALHWAVNVLDHGDLHNAFLSDNLGNVDDTLLSEDLALNQLGGGMSDKGATEAGQQHWLSQLGGGGEGLVFGSESD
jgi:hypothetical protein